MYRRETISTVILHTAQGYRMTAALPCPTFNWKCSDQLCIWDHYQAKTEFWLAGEKFEKALQYTKIVLMLDEGLSRCTKFKLSDHDRKDPQNIFKAFWESLGKDVSYWTGWTTLYNSFCQQKGETAAELDIRLMKIIDECQFPTEDITNFLKRDILINAINYYEVKKWASLQKETGDTPITSTEVMDKCKEYEATVCDCVAMVSDNPQLQTSFQQGTVNVDSHNFKWNKYKGRGRRNRSSSHSGSRECQPQNKQKDSRCKQCGLEHHTTPGGACPAIKATCGYCQKVGHYESTCITKCTQKNKEAKETIHKLFWQYAQQPTH